MPYPPDMSLGGTDAATRSGVDSSTSDARVADAELLRRMQQGEEAALGAFYDRWFPIVNCLVTRIVRSPADADDVVEATFWQAWRQANRYEHDRGTVQTWLLTIARSRALDRLRTNRRRREDSIDDAGGGVVGAFIASPSDPSLDAEHAERKQLVLAALAELPAEQREALELGYFSGLSQSQIAERTGQPLGTIKTRMRLAMQKLRERLSTLRGEGPV